MQTTIQAISTQAFVLALTVLAPLPCNAEPPPLSFAAPVLATASDGQTLSSYALPVGPYAAGALPLRRAEGEVRRRAVRLDAPGATTLELLAPLRDQLAAAGYRVLYECAAFECGGFDFRYGIDVLPEPDMHVDLGDYRYLAAEHPEAGAMVGLLVSRSAQAGFVQVVDIGPAAAAPSLTASTKSPETPAPIDDAARPVTGTRVLEDLVFASGAGSLAPGDYPSLTALAGEMAQRPDLQLTLLGHTDASGPSQANKALSQQRAEAVRQVLMAAGIDGARIAARGMGPDQPRADNATAEGRQQNRRVEAVVTLP